MFSPLLQPLLQPLMRGPMEPSGRTLIQRAIAVLRRFGSDAHVYLPGASVPVLGPELWSAASIFAADTATAVNGSVVFSSSAANITAAQPALGMTNKTLLCTYTISGIDASESCRIVLYGSGVFSVGVTRVSNGTFNETLVLNTAGGSFTDRIAIQTVSGGTLTVSNISVREITGYTSMLNGLQAGNYLDSAGTTQGTVDQPVGLVLDAAGGLGPNVVVNGRFETAANWSLGQQTTVAGGKATIASTGAASSLGQLSILNATSTYLITWDAVVRSGTAKLEASGGGTFTVIDSTKSYSCYFTGTTSVVFNRVTACDIDIENVVAQEVTGIAASQPTTSAKPILRRGAVNLLTYSGDFGNAIWIKNAGVTVTGSVVSGATGEAWGSALLNRALVGLLPSTSYTAAFLLKSRGSTTATVYLRDQSNGAISSSVLALTDEYQMVVTTLTSSASTTSLAPLFGGTNGDVEIGTAALFQGTYTAQQIQALGGIPLTSTAPASTALGPQYWQFDGSNDSLSLGSVPFTQADDWCVSVAARLDAAGSTRSLYSHSNASNNQVAWLSFNTAGNLVWTTWDGTTTVIITSPLTHIGTTIVARMMKVGTAGTLWVNGVQVASASFSATTSPALTTASIGSFNGVALQHGGSINQAISVKGTLTQADALLVDRFAASAAGVQI